MKSNKKSTFCSHAHSNAGALPPEITQAPSETKGARYFGAQPQRPAELMENGTRGTRRNFVVAGYLSHDWVNLGWIYRSCWIIGSFFCCYKQGYHDIYQEIHKLTPAYFNMNFWAQLGRWEISDPPMCPICSSWWLTRYDHILPRQKWPVKSVLFKKGEHK